MERQENRKDMFWEIVGSFLIALSLYNFAVQAQFPMTGFSGIALILYRLFEWPIGLTTIVLNIPVAVVCYRLIGRRFLLKSLRCMVIGSVFVDYIAPLLPVYQGSRLLSALVTGVLGGIGYAVIYMRRSSTGGADFIIMAVKAANPHIKLGTIVFLFDLGIVVTGGILFQDVDGIIYGIMIAFLLAVVVDRVMGGLNEGKVGFVVTEQGDAVCAVIDQSAGRGSTVLLGRGGYQKGKKEIVLVACSAKEMYQIAQAVKKMDRDVFMIVMNASEVHGEGFQVI